MPAPWTGTFSVPCSSPLRVRRLHPVLGEDHVLHGEPDVELGGVVAADRDRRLDVGFLLKRGDVVVQAAPVELVLEELEIVVDDLLRGSRRAVGGSTLAAPPDCDFLQADEVGIRVLDLLGQELHARHDVRVLDDLVDVTGGGPGLPGSVRGDDRVQDGAEIEVAGHDLDLDRLLLRLGHRGHCDARDCDGGHEGDSPPGSPPMSTRIQVFSSVTAGAPRPRLHLLRGL